MSLSIYCAFRSIDAKFYTGTVISISESSDISCTAPISARLHQRDTTLRATADPSLLVQSLLDLSEYTAIDTDSVHVRLRLVIVVDQALEVVDEYQKKILKLEHDVLVQPNVKTVRFCTCLHV